MDWYDDIANITKGNVQGLVDALRNPVDTVKTQFEKGAPYRKALASAIRGDVAGVNKALSQSNLTPSDFAGFAGALAPLRYQGGFLKGMPNVIDMGNGKLEQFGTDKRIVDTAHQYMADKGLSYNPQTIYTNVDVNFAKRLADAYQHMKDNPSDPAVKKSYDALINQTMDQYEASRKAGQKYEFMPEGQDLYGNPRNAINDIVTNQHMYVFPTEEGFGSLTEAQAANPLLQKTGEK